MPVLEIGQQNGLPYLVMPMLDGISLRTMLAREPKISPDRAICMVRQIAEGLEYAHQRGVLHRDIKPDNLWVTPTGDIKLLDFGLARTTDDMAPITKAGTVLGTPSYMSPEQVTGKQLDGRSDLFSLGVVLVEMLTGHSPFQKTNLFSTLMSVAGDEIQFDELDEGGEIPVGLREVVQRLLKKNANERVGSAGELIALLNRVQSSPQQDLTVPIATTGNRWWKTIAAALAGFAICLGGLAIWNATDKGTLVVQTSDPSVEIKIANERVSIHDPVTDRKYEIRIGETPLPSGVYQLETTDSTGDLAFSSGTITIRRGEKAIVTVELRPPEAVVGQPAANPLVSIAAAENVEDSTLWADKSFDPMARDDFARTLPVLEGKRIVDAMPLESFGQGSTVGKPARLAGIGLWSLEAPPSNSIDPISNADGSLFATKGGMVWIRDSQGKVRHVLPVNGFLADFQFDNRFPNLIATVAWQGRQDLSVDSPAQPQGPYEIAIWRLADDSAELLHTIPSNGPTISWDQGYRMVYVLGNQFVAFRLDDARTHPLHECLDSRLKGNSISPDGRFLATVSRSAEQSIVNLHDLKAGKFVGSYPSVSQFQWKNDGMEIATFNSDNKSPIEIWRTDKPVMQKRVEMTFEVANKADQTSATSSFRALEGNLHRLAYLTKDGILTIRNLENNRQSSLTMSGFTGMEGCRMLWLDDGSLQIRGTSGEYRWTAGLTDVHGEIEVVRLAAGGLAANRQRPRGIGIGLVNQFDNHATIFRKHSTSGGFTTGYELTRLELDPPLVGEHSVFVDHIGEWMEAVSPDGKYCIRKQGEDESSNLNMYEFDLIDLASGEVVVHFGEFLDHKANEAGQSAISAARLAYNRTWWMWSPDSRYLLFSGYGTSRRKPSLLRIWTASTGDLIDVKSLANPQYLSQYVDWFQDRFRIDVGNGPNKAVGPSDYRSINPQNGELEKAPNISGFDSFSPVWSNGNEMIFEGVKLGAPRNTGSTQGERVFYRGTLVDGDFPAIQEMRVKEFDKVQFSSDGMLFLNVSIAGDEVTARGERRFPLVSGSPRYRLSIGRWPTEPLTDVPKEFLYETSIFFQINSPAVWHSSGKSVMWAEQQQGLAFVNTESLTVKHWPPFQFPTFVPTGFGWLVANNNLLIAIDQTGERLGELVFDADSVGGKPANPRWILENGSIAANAERDGLYMVFCRNDRVYCEPLTRFIANPENPKLPTFDQVPFLNAEVGQ